MTKTVKQMNKTELAAYAASVGREDITDSMTKKEMLLALEEDGLDEVAEPEIVEERANIPASNEDEQIIRMTRDVSYYSYGKYVFTRDRKFVLMDRESADAIVKNNPGDFKVASTKEVEEYYK